MTWSLLTWHLSKITSNGEYRGDHRHATLKLINNHLLVFRFRREACGQTKATTINYLKNLRSLFNFILRSYIYEDATFPRGFDGQPCAERVNRIKLLDHKLDLIYKRATKQQPAELFKRKTQEAKDIPDYSGVMASLDAIYRTIEGNLAHLGTFFAQSAGGYVVVRSEKNSSPAEKRVRAFTVNRSSTIRTL